LVDLNSDNYAMELIETKMFILDKMFVQMKDIATASTDTYFRA
jgi:hypothetical protein